MIQEKIVLQMVIATSQHFVSKVTDKLIKQFTDNFEKHLSETGAKKVKPENFYTVFHVDEYRDENYQMELWTQVEAIGANTDDIQFKTVPQSQVAYIVVSESYENLKSAYDALFKYVREHDYIVNGYPRETYLYDDSAPYGYSTEIQLPFEKKQLRPL